MRHLKLTVALTSTSTRSQPALALSLKAGLATNPY